MNDSFELSKKFESRAQDIGTTLQVDQEQLTEDAQNIACKREVTDTPRGTQNIITEVIQARVEDPSHMADQTLRKKATKFAQTIRAPKTHSNAALMSSGKKCARVFI